ncbi:MAG: hypothetical protein IT340_18650 [Chloroflexi bacterium]|nr:hypothetical protein [Chloroflexota bacterium]
MSDREQQVKRLVLTAVDGCGICGCLYEPDNLDVIGQRGEIWMLRACCPRCSKQGFIAALVNAAEPAVASAPAAESQPGGGQTLVTAQDVLAMHEFLAVFEGDLGAYLRGD